VEREVKGTLYFFVDACREISRDVALTLGANPYALKAVDLNKPMVSTSVSLIEATGEGKLAFAVEGRVSRFTEALITALSGYCGVKAAGSQTWDIDGETIASAIRKLLETQQDCESSSSQRAEDRGFVGAVAQDHKATEGQGRVRLTSRTDAGSFQDVSHVRQRGHI